MGLDQYKVEVLEYINPHLIWVLVRNERDENAFHFEQIGIYGILPLNISLGVDCVINAEPCEQWMPAAAMAMGRCFHDAAQVLFVPTYISKKSSIFSVHKYGDLLVVKKNGEEVNVLQEIVDSSCGYSDEHLFYQQLRGNNLETKLNFITLHEVTKKIEESYKTRGIPKDTWLDVFKSQTSVQNKGQLLESAITAQKPKVYDEDNVDMFLKNNQNVLKLCKDIDEVSVGRACSPRNSSISGKSSIVSMALRKKMEWLESQSLVNQPKKANEPEADNSENQPPNIHTADEKTNDIHSGGDVFEDTDKDFNGYKKNTNNRKGKNPRTPIDQDKKFVAYGPAGLDRGKFVSKPATINNEKPVPVVQETSKPKSEPEYQAKKSEDVYANTDSEPRN